MMKVIVTILLLSLSHPGYSQCELLDYIPDTIEFKGVKIVYYQSDSIVKIKYSKNDFTREFPVDYALDCDQKYLPSVWRPRWRNDRFIGFTSGCGTWCFGNILAPLNAIDSFKEAGQVLIDSVHTIYFSLYRDTSDRAPYLFIENFNTDKVQRFELNSNDFWGAILLEQLDYDEPHPNGFAYENKILTLYGWNQDNKRVTTTFRIEI